MIINIAGLLAAAALLVTLVTLEVRHAGPATGQTARPRLLSGRAVAVIWAIYLILFLPRLLELLT